MKRRRSLTFTFSAVAGCWLRRSCTCVLLVHIEHVGCWFVGRVLFKFKVDLDHLLHFAFIFVFVAFQILSFLIVSQSKLLET